MGLAEPKRRFKIANDPRNLAWSQSSSSFGQRMMAKHGWEEGQSLGNRSSAHIGLNDVDRLAAARVGVLFKDDNLGLGAKHKSKDLEGQRTGLDAFQGLLGRLNGKSDKELKMEERKVEDRKLEMYAKGRWGGMVFVKGGTLVGDRDFGTGEKTENSSKAQESETVAKGTKTQQDETVDDQEAEKRKQKEEKRQRKEVRRIRREKKAVRKAAEKAKQKPQAREADSDGDEEDDTEQPALPSHKSPLVQAPDEPVSSSSSANEDSKSAKLKRKRSSTVIVEPQVKTAVTTPARNGRHLLRGRNIQAKKMAFSDMKGLEEIFMKTG